MKILALDFETYWSSKDYTLKKMTTESYVRDPRFEALCLGMYDPLTDRGSYYTKPDIADFLAAIDWSETGVIFHHAQFDGFILSHHFNVIPAFLFDTISMGRIAYGPCQRLSLAALAEKHGLGEKTVPYQLFDGKRFHELSNGVMQQLGEGSVHDCKLCYQLFVEMLPLVPPFEMKLIDKTVRMFTEPKLVGDVEMLTRICKEEADRKQTILGELGVLEKDLQSAPKFVRILESLGVHVEHKDGKLNEKTGICKKIPAIAKTDEFMQELCEHEDETISALAEARLGVRSTIKSTRAGRLLTMAERGRLCNYTHHAGAHTLRGTGGDKANFRNLPRGSELRKAVRAPEGFKLSIIDAKQIELRTELWLAGDKEKLEFLERGGDAYCDMATKIFGFEVTKEDKERRHIGKETVLGCGYGMGEHKFVKYVNGKNIQIDGKRLIIDDELAIKSVHTYRENNPLVLQLWKKGLRVMKAIANGEEFSWKCFTIRDKKVYAPTGSYMHYDTLQYGLIYPDDAKPDWFMYPKRNRKSKMYGAKFIENINQFLARCVVAEAALRMPKDVPLVLETYDELVHLVHTENQHMALMRIAEIRPNWAPDLPIEMEGGIYDRYEK
jgi:DNA polymerase family A